MRIFFAPVTGLLATPADAGLCLNPLDGLVYAWKLDTFPWFMIIHRFEEFNSYYGVYYVQAATQYK